MKSVTVKIRQLAHGAELPLPAYMTDGSAGLDLMAAISKDLKLEPGQRQLVPTGIQIALPPGYEGQVRPRSGLALKYGVTLLNTPGTIDSDYRGEIKVLLINLGEEPFCLKPGYRIAQLVVQPVPRVCLELDAELDETERGPGGFGHTGR